MTLDSAAPQVPTHPKGPIGDVIFGNALDYYRHRLGFIQSMVRDFGDISRYRIECDWYYLINDPAICRSALTDWTRIDNAMTDGWLYLDKSFLAVHGRGRAKPRSIVHAAMNPRSLAARHDAMLGAIDETVAAWEDGKVRNTLTDMMGLSLDMIAQTLIGDAAREGLAPVREFLTNLERLAGRSHITEEERERFSFENRRAAFVALDEAVGEIVAKAEKSPGPHTPAMTTLMEGAEGNFPERGLVHELCVLLLSHSSTAVMASWVWYALSNNPEVCTRVEEELDRVLQGRAPTVEDLAELTYLDAVLKETLRLYPPVALMPRVVVEDWTCGPYHVAAGSRLHISPYLLHRHPEIWSEPEAFLPERWIEGSEHHRKVPPAAFIPFGYGVRRCIGEQLSLRQAKLMIATIASRFRLKLRAEHVVAYDASPAGVIYPHDLDLPMVVTRRGESA